MSTKLIGWLIWMQLGGLLQVPIKFQISKWLKRRSKIRELVTWSKSCSRESKQRAHLGRKGHQLTRVIIRLSIKRAVKVRGFSILVRMNMAMKTPAPITQTSTPNSKTAQSWEVREAPRKRLSPHLCDPRPSQNWVITRSCRQANKRLTIIRVTTCLLKPRKKHPNN